MANKKTTKPVESQEKKKEELSGVYDMSAPVIFFEFDPNTSRDSQLDTFVAEHNESSKDGWTLFINIVPGGAMEMALNDRMINVNNENRSLSLTVAAIDENVLNTACVVNAVAVLIATLDYTFDEIIMLTKNLANVKNKADVDALHVYVEQGTLIGGVPATTLIQEVYKKKPDLMVSDLVKEKKEAKKEKDKKKKKKGKKKGKK